MVDNAVVLEGVCSQDPHPGSDGSYGSGSYGATTDASYGGGAYGATTQASYGAPAYGASTTQASYGAPAYGASTTDASYGGSSYGGNSYGSYGGSSAGLSCSAGQAQQASDSDDGLGGGAIAGIAVGAVVGAGLLGGAAVWAVKSGAAPAFRKQHDVDATNQKNKLESGEMPPQMMDGAEPQPTQIPGGETA